MAHSEALRQGKRFPYLDRRVNYLSASIAPGYQHKIRGHLCPSSGVRTPKHHPPPSQPPSSQPPAETR
jgi:hypothetical protein